MNIKQNYPNMQPENLTPPRSGKDSANALHQALHYSPDQRYGYNQDGFGTGRKYRTTDAIIDQRCGPVKHLNLTVTHNKAKGSEPQIELALVPRSDDDKAKIETMLDDLKLFSYTDAPYSDPRQASVRKPALPDMELIVLPEKYYPIEKIDEVLGKLRAKGLIEERTEELGFGFVDPMLRGNDKTWLALKTGSDQKELFSSELGNDIRNERRR